MGEGVLYNSVFTELPYKTVSGNVTAFYTEMVVGQVRGVFTPFLGPVPRNAISASAPNIARNATPCDVSKIFSYLLHTSVFYL